MHIINFFCIVFVIFNDDYELDLRLLTPKSRANFISNIDINIKTVPEKPLCFSAPHSLGISFSTASAAIIKDSIKAEALFSVFSSSSSSASASAAADAHN